MKSPLINLKPYTQTLLADTDYTAIKYTEMEYDLYEPLIIHGNSLLVCDKGFAVTTTTSKLPLWQLPVENVPSYQQILPQWQALGLNPEVPTILFPTSLLTQLHNRNPHWFHLKFPVVQRTITLKAGQFIGTPPVDTKRLENPDVLSTLDL